MRMKISYLESYLIKTEINLDRGSFMLHDPYREFPELFNRIFRTISETNSWLQEVLGLDISTEEYIQISYVEGFGGPYISLKRVDDHNVITVEIPVIFLERVRELPNLKKFKLFNVVEVWISHEYLSKLLPISPWGKSNDPMVSIFDLSLRDSITLYRSSIPPTSYSMLREKISEFHKDLVRAPISDYYFTGLGSKTLKTLEKIVDMGFDVKSSAAILFNTTIEKIYGADLEYLKNLANEKLRMNRSLDEYVVYDGEIVWERVKRLVFNPLLSIKEMEEGSESLKLLINRILAKKEEKKTEELTYMKELRGALKKRGKASD